MGQDLERRGPMSNGRVQFATTGVNRPAEGRKIALLVPFLVAVNVVMFFITMYINNCPHNTDDNRCVPKFFRRVSFQPLSENPLLGPSTHTLQKLGALNVKKVVHDHQGWRLITCIWLHAGVIHIVVNMLSLLFIGIRLEQEFGPLKIGIIYLISGLGGSLLSALFLRKSLSVGASGALFGLLGAMLSELITNWTRYSNKCAALMTLVFVVVVNLAIGILPHVDNFAHIGGFISGFLAGFVLLLKAPYERAVGSPVRTKHKLYQYILCLVALMILIAGFSVAMVMVLRGVDGNKKCSWCHYLSCVPTSRWNCDSSGGSEYCKTIQIDNQIQLTCISNNKTISTTADHSQGALESLCNRLCS